MSRLCYLTRNYPSLNGAGNKAKNDNEQTLQSLGAINLGLKTSYYDNVLLHFFLNLFGVIRMAFTIRAGDQLVLQYPVKKYFSFICRVAHWRKATTIVLIHDLTSMHRKRITIEKEISRLMRADYVIASNEAMKQWLQHQGLTRPTGALGLFDYRSAATPENDSVPASSHRYALVYAGALVMRKNAYLLDLARMDRCFDLHVYGNSDGLPGLQEAKHVVCYPFTPADTFIRSAEGDFGLVWDGDSLDTCHGDFGEYLRYNSPHKVSFYLRAGLPVIIWKQAAVASIIEEEGIGICVESMKELERLLASITPEQMQQMKTNVKRVSDRLKRGDFFTQALQQAQDELKSLKV